MAAKVRGITIELGADTTGLSKALGKVNTDIGKTQKELKDVNKLLKLDPGNTDLLAQKHRMLGDSVAETKEKLNALKNAQDEITQAYKNGDIDQGQYEAFQREIISCENELKNLQKEFYESNVAAQKLANIGESMQKVGSGMESVGQKIMPISTAVTGIGAAAVKVTADFDASMSKVAAISGATGDNFDKLRDKAREMGSKTKFSASEAADAMQYMAMAGWKTEEMLGGIEGIMNLAAASGEDLATTSDIVTDALTAFGLKAEDSSKFADLLAQTASNANTNVAMMGETFKYAAPVMGAMGYSAEDTALAIGLMGNAGIKASNAGTALRGFVTRLAKPTKESSEAMQRLGLEIYDDEGKMYSFLEVMEQLRGSFDHINMPVEEFDKELAKIQSQLEDGTLTQKKFDDALDELVLETFGAEEAEKARAAAMLAGKNALSGLLAIVNASDEDFYKLKDAIDTSGGAAERIAETMQDNLSGQLTILMSQLQELAIQFGDMLMPTLRKCVEWLQSLMDKLNGMDDSTRNMILKVGLIVAALAPLLIVGGKVISGIGTLLTFIPTLIGALGGLFAFIAANPIVIAITAIIAAIVLCIKYWDEIKEAFSIGWEAIKESFSEGWQALKDFCSSIAESVKTAFTEMWESTKTAFSNAWESIKATCKAIAEGIKNTFTEMWRNVKEAFTTGWENIKTAFTAGWEKLKAICNVIANGIKSIFNGVWNVIKGFINSIINGVEYLINDGFINGVNVILKGINTIGNAVGKLIGLNPINLSLNTISLPRLAKGGTVLSGSAIVGEAGAELLNVSNGAATVTPLGGGGIGHTDITELLKTYLPLLAEGNQIYLDTGTLVGATAPAMNNALGRIATRAGAR